LPVIENIQKVSKIP